MPVEPSNRRRSVRKNEHGMVVLVTAGAAAQQISGILMDENEHGFRARHPYSGFQPGHLVSFIHRCGEGVARVIWHKAFGSEFETGFAYF
jgi:hypothetical protein